MSNSLNQDQVGHSVRPDLGPNCLQRSSADDKLAGKELTITHLQFVQLLQILIKSQYEQRLVISNDIDGAF